MNQKNTIPSILINLNFHNKKKFHFLIVILLLIFTNEMQAQRATRDKVGKFNKRDVHAIEENGQVSGYFFVYRMEKENREENRYNLCIYDTNFKSIHNIELVKPKKIEWVDAKFNGREYCFQMLDLDKKRYEFTVYDASLQEVGKFLLPLPKEIAEAITEAAQSGYEGNFVQTYTLFGLPEQGFGVYGMNPENNKLEITAYSTAGEELWRANSGVLEKKVYEFAHPVFLGKNQIGFEFLFYKNFRKPNEGIRKLIRFDTKTGEKLGETLLSELKHTVWLSDQFQKEEETVLCGEYSDTQEQSGGIALITLAEDGKVTSELYISLKQEAARIVDDKTKIKTLEEKSLLIHKLLITADNNLFVVAEIFDKNYVYDLLVFEIKENLLQKVFFADKPKTNISSWVSGVNSLEGLGALLKTGLMDGSDYCYTSLNQNKTEFTTVHCNFETAKDRYTIGSINYSEGNSFQKKQTQLTSKPTFFTVLPAKPGHVAVFEYFEKEKRVNLYIEKMK